MKYGKKTVRMGRKEAVGMQDLVKMYIRSAGISTELNRQRIYVAWNKVSGAASFTLNRYVKNGVLYCAISSSMVRNRLYLSRLRLVELINGELENDELFTKEDKTENFIKSIVFK